MAQTDGQQPILYVEDGSMSVLPKGAEPARHVSVGETKSNLDLETQGATGEKTGSLGYDSEVAGTGDADFEDAGNVMAALEKQEKAPFPEGGRQAWLTVLGTFCCTMVTFGVLNTYGVSLLGSIHPHTMIDRILAGLPSVLQKDVPFRLLEFCHQLDRHGAIRWHLWSWSASRCVRFP